MRLRGNIILQYTITTVTIVLAITIALGFTLTRRIAAYQINSHIRLYQEVVRLTVRDDANVYALFEADSPGSARIC